jgi:hypothetical protein
MRTTHQGRDRERSAFASVGIEPMLIHRLLQNMPMGPEEISRLTTAYELAMGLSASLTGATR